MNAYEKSLQLDLSGTDSEKVAQLKSVTLSAIRLEYLMELLNFRNMLRKTDSSAGQEKWTGTLQTMKAALVAANLTDKVTAYEMWFSHVTNPRQITWDTRFPVWASPFLEMELAFAGQSGMPSQADFDAVVALGGGRPYSSLTTTEFSNQRNAYNASVAKSNFTSTIFNPGYNTYIASYIDGSGTLTSAGLATALELWASGLRP